MNVIFSNWADLGRFRQGENCLFMSEKGNTVPFSSSVYLRRLVLWMAPIFIQNLLIHKKFTLDACLAVICELESIFAETLGFNSLTNFN